MNGILFKPDMRQAIVEGRKTQTRRLSGLKEINKEDVWRYNGWANSWQGFAFINIKTNLSKIVKPRYQVGQTYYIKESHRFTECDGNLNDFGVEYKDGDCRLWRDNAGEMGYPINGRWRSPMFLEARFARYFIKITAVRYERLQSITPEDCLAEGIIVPHQSAYESQSTDYRSPLELLKRYHVLWDTINPDYPWQSNPFVVAYSFVKTEKPV